MATHLLFPFALYASRPHPDPLPRGEEDHIRNSQIPPARTAGDQRQAFAACALKLDSLPSPHSSALGTASTPPPLDERAETQASVGSRMSPFQFLPRSRH